MDSEARLVLDEGFERAVARVVDAFVCEGFTVKALDRGNLHRPASQGLLRYALLDAVLPDPPVDTQGSGSTLSTHSACRLCLVELTGSCTLVAAEPPLAPYSLLASPSREADHVASALRLAIRHGSRPVAA